MKIKLFNLLNSTEKPTVYELSDIAVIRYTQYVKIMWEATRIYSAYGKLTVSTTSEDIGVTQYDAVVFLDEEPIIGITLEENMELPEGDFAFN